MLGVFAEFETNIRRERQAAGIAKAKRERPEAYSGRKPSISAEEIKTLLVAGMKPDEAADEFKSPSWFGPQWVAAQNPTNTDARNTLMFEALIGGVDASARPNLYIPISEQWQNIQNRAQELTKLAEFNANEALVAELGNNWQTLPYAWLPLKANNQDMVVLVNPEQPDNFKIVNLRPW